MSWWLHHHGQQQIEVAEDLNFYHFCPGWVSLLLISFTKPSFLTGCPWKWWKHHPRRDLKALWMWHLEIWVDDGLGSAGDFFDSMVWEGFSNLNNSVITRRSNCIPIQVFEALQDWKMLLESRPYIFHSKQELTPPNISLVVIWVAFSGWDSQWLFRLHKILIFPTGKVFLWIISICCLSFSSWAPRQLSCFPFASALSVLGVCSHHLFTRCCLQ